MSKALAIIFEGIKSIHVSSRLYQYLRIFGYNGAKGAKDGGDGRRGPDGDMMPNEIHF